SSHSERSASPLMNLSRISSTYLSISAPVDSSTLFSSEVNVKRGQISSGTKGSILSAASIDCGADSPPWKYSDLMIPLIEPNHVNCFAKACSNVMSSSGFKM